MTNETISSIRKQGGVIAGSAPNNGNYEGITNKLIEDATNPKKNSGFIERVRGSTKEGYDLFSSFPEVEDKASFAIQLLEKGLNYPKQGDVEFDLKLKAYDIVSGKWQITTYENFARHREVYVALHEDPSEVVGIIDLLIEMFAYLESNRTGESGESLNLVQGYFNSVRSGITETKALENLTQALATKEGAVGQIELNGNPSAELLLNMCKIITQEGIESSPGRTLIEYIWKAVEKFFQKAEAEIGSEISGEERRKAVKGKVDKYMLPYMDEISEALYSGNDQG